MTIARKIAYNTVFATGARLAGVALSLVSIGLIARYLGNEGFGNYSLILAFLYIFNILADFGLYSLMAREISRPGADEKKIASNIFSIRVVALLGFLGLAVILIWFFPYASEIKVGMLIASVGYLFLSASQVLMGIFQKYLRIDKAGLSDLIARVVQLGLVVVMIYFKMGLFAILMALNISSVVNFILNWIFSRKYVSIKLTFDSVLWKKIIKDALPIAASIVLTLIYFKLDTVFLSLKFINRHSVNPIADVGIYNIAYKVLEGLIFFPSMFVGVMMPILSNFAISSLEEFKKTFQRIFDILIVFIIPIVVGLIMLALPIVVLVGGSQFKAAAPALQILSIAIGFIFIGSLLGNSIIALNKQKSGAWIYFGGMIFNIITNLIFIPKYSYLGAASTTAVTELLVTLLMFCLIYRTIKYLPSVKIILKAVIAGLIMAAFLYCFKSWNVFVLMAGGAVIYFAVLYLIKGVKKDEIALLIKR